MEPVVNRWPTKSRNPVAEHQQQRRRGDGQPVRADLWALQPAQQRQRAERDDGAHVEAIAREQQRRQVNEPDLDGGEASPPDHREHREQAGVLLPRHGCGSAAGGLSVSIDAPNAGTVGAESQ